MCGAMKGTPRATTHPLVEAGNISLELASIFKLPEEYVAPCRKRPLRIKSKSRVMTGDEVHRDLKKQREEIEEKKRIAAEKNAA